MARVPKASHTGSPVTAASPTPARAKSRPISAAVSSSSTTASSGFLVVRMNDHQLWSPRSGSASRTAVRRDSPSRTRATTRMATAIPTDSSSWGWRSFS
jgi:hypothetical protein